MSLCSIRVFDTAQIAANAAGDAFIKGLSESGSRLAGLAAGRTMKPVYDYLVGLKTGPSGCSLKQLSLNLTKLFQRLGQGQLADEINRICCQGCQVATRLSDH